MRFVHDTLPQRVAFGSGEAAANLSGEIAGLGATRVMLIAAKAEMHLADTIAADLPVALRHDDVVMHVPVEVAERARAGGRRQRRRRSWSASAAARRRAWPRRSR